MPQATKELCEKMEEYFGQGADEAQPIKYLQDHGYKLTRDWSWNHPIIDSYDEMTQKAYDCLIFLIQEWDYGGLKTYA